MSNGEKTNENSQNADNSDLKIFEYINEELSTLITNRELKLNSKKYEEKINSIAGLIYIVANADLLQLNPTYSKGIDLIKKDLDKFMQVSWKEQNKENIPKMPPKTRIKNFVLNIVESLDKHLGISSTKLRTRSKTYYHILNKAEGFKLREFATFTKHKPLAPGKNTKKTSQRGI